MNFFLQKEKCISLPSHNAPGEHGNEQKYRMTWSWNVMWNMTKKACLFLKFIEFFVLFCTMILKQAKYGVSLRKWALSRVFQVAIMVVISIFWLGSMFYDMRGVCTSCMWVNPIRHWFSHCKSIHSLYKIVAKLAKPNDISMLTKAGHCTNQWKAACRRGWYMVLAASLPPT